MEPFAPVLSLWFGNTIGQTPPPEVQKRWWKKDPQFDRSLARDFGSLHHRAAAGELQAWTEQPRPCVALVVVLDQLSRNIHRDTANAFACDAAALATVDLAL